MPITKGTSLEDIIHDFVHSDNPKFAGKSKEERIKMAQGAYYSMHKESVVDNTNESLIESTLVHRNLVQTLKQFGFKKDKEYPHKTVYYHSVLGDVHAFNDGSWNHHSGKGNELLGSGNSTEEFENHIKGLQKDMFKESTTQLLTSILSEDKDSFKEQLNRSLLEKISAKIEEKKEQFAEEMFGELDESTNSDSGKIRDILHKHLGVVAHRDSIGKLGNFFTDSGKSGRRFKLSYLDEPVTDEQHQKISSDLKREFGDRYHSSKPFVSVSGYSGKKRDAYRIQLHRPE